MTRETLTHLNTQTLIGFGRQAWHFRADLQGDEANHYPHAIPGADVRRRLFSFDAVSAPLMALSPTGPVSVSGHVANVRSDTGEVLGIVSERYTLHQFHDSLLDGVAKITGSGLGISSAGVLKGGAVGWVSVSLADTTTTPEGVEFLPYLMAYGSHDGSLVTGYKRVITNVVCDNTMGMALREGAGGNYRIRHTRNSAIRIADAQAALGIIVESGDTFAAQVKDLCEQAVTPAQWSAFVEAHVPMPEAGRDKTSRGVTMAESKRDSLKSLWVNDARVAPWSGTAWGVVQAVNTHAHHVQTVRGTTRGERNTLATLSGDWDALDVATMATLDRILTTV